MRIDAGERRSNVSSDGQRVAASGAAREKSASFTHRFWFPPHARMAPPCPSEVRA